MRVQTKFLQVYRVVSGFSVKRFLATSIASFGLLAFFSGNVHSGQTGELDWLSGCWVFVNEGSVTEEIWMPEKAGMMLGMGRTYAAEKVSFFEWLKITVEENGEALYSAAPFGGKTTLFVAKPPFENRVIFENPAHDFPQKIKYELTENNELVATVSAIQNGKVEGFENRYQSCQKSFGK